VYSGQLGQASRGAQPSFLPVNLKTVRLAPARFDNEGQGAQPERATRIPASDESGLALGSGMPICYSWYGKKSHARYPKELRLRRMRCLQNQYGDEHGSRHIALVVGRANTSDHPSMAILRTLRRRYNPAAWVIGANRQSEEDDCASSTVLRFLHATIAGWLTNHWRQAA
jgi:hypothetical protein